MTLAVFGGSFNPPHIGHLTAAKNAVFKTRPDKLLVMPANRPPHKALSDDEPGVEARMEMSRLCFAEIDCAEVSSLEIARGGTSYTAQTVRELKAKYPGERILLFMGTDMLESFELWKDFEYIIQNAAIVVFQREDGEEGKIAQSASRLADKYSAEIEIVLSEHRVVSSSGLRRLLKNRQGRDFFPEEEYEYIIANRLYGSKPELQFLREKAYAMLKAKRIPHVQGCEKEAVRLAKRYGADETEAAEAAILHDITKKLPLSEQLKLCEKYDIMTDALEKANEKLLHAKTGAGVASAMFGVSEEVRSAINWHTTGKADMTLLEKIIYLADYIEETRHFDGVEKLRSLAYEDLDQAMILGLQTSIKEIEGKGHAVHKNTLLALEWFKGVIA